MNNFRKQYTVKIKDLDQDITHTVTQSAETQAEANKLALKALRKLLGTFNLEIK